MTDLVLAMEENHLKTVESIYPPARGRAFLLEEFARGRREEIPDPVGGSYQGYRECLRKIEQNITALLERLSLQ